MKLKILFARIGMVMMLSVPFIANSTIIIIDNSDVGFFTSSGFSSSTYEGGYVGGNYLVDVGNRVGDFAKWDPTNKLDWLAGVWKVEMNWTSGPTRATNALVTIGSPLNTVLVDQTVNGGTSHTVNGTKIHVPNWYDLGTYNFGTTDATVMIDDSNSTSGHRVIADAVRFTLVSTATAIPVPATILLLLVGFAAMRLRSRK